MHTRRLASYILGAWLLGSLFFTFVTTQTMVTVDRIMESPPGPVAKDIEDLGSDLTRILLQYQATEFNRFLTNTWEVLQIGLALAFISATILTAHRSKFLIIVSTLMLGIVITQTTYLSPSMAALGRSFDFLPKTAAPQERENYRNFEVMYNTASVVKLLLGATLAARLLFDRYGFQKKFSTDSSGRQLRRRRRTSSSGSRSGSTEPSVTEPVSQSEEKHSEG
jgi:hypothetical protein